MSVVIAGEGWGGSGGSGGGGGGGDAGGTGVEGGIEGEGGDEGGEGGVEGEAVAERHVVPKAAPHVHTPPLHASVLSHSRPGHA